MRRSLSSPNLPSPQKQRFQRDNHDMDTMVVNRIKQFKVRGSKARERPADENAAPKVNVYANKKAGAVPSLKKKTMPELKTMVRNLCAKNDDTEAFWKGENEQLTAQVRSMERRIKQLVDQLENERVRVSILREERDQLQLDLELSRDELEQERTERARVARANLRRFVF